MFTATDDEGYVLALTEFTDVRFILGFLEAEVAGGTSRYTSYTTTSGDADGIPNSGDETFFAGYDTARLNGLTQLEDGTLKYRFAKVLPAAKYNGAITHQIGGQFRRAYAPTGVIYVANAENAFRPDGGVVTETRNVVETASCDGCHTRLEMHGGPRRDVQLCIMCHNRQTVAGNGAYVYDFPVMIHKMHMSENLPSVQAGTPYELPGHDGLTDFSEIAFPQDVRNCEVCHGAAKNQYYLNHPSLAGCGSCHDRTWFGNVNDTPEGFENHIIPQVDDTNCALCHQPTGGIAGITEAHLRPQETSDAPGLALDITDVTTIPPTKDKAGVGLEITFTAVDGAGDPITDLTTVSRVSTVVAWPTSDFQTFKNETIRGTSASPGVLVNNGDGSYVYTFSATLPEGSTDTFAVAMMGRQAFTHGGEEEEQGTATNGYTEFTLAKIDPVPRRTVVSNAKCSKCHGEVRMHGESREGIELCVMCHNPNTTDEANRPADQMPPVTVNFKEMIHRIHTGENLTEGYTVYGRGGTPADFTEILFPGRREQCSICHEDASNIVPLPEEAVSTLITQGGEPVSEIAPTRAACTSCHDSVEANVHANINTGTLKSGIETCVVCHGADADFAVSVVHTIGP